MARSPKCTDPVDGALLAAYEAGLLTPQEQADFEAHLDVCDACTDDLYALAHHIAALHRQPRRAAEHMVAATHEVGERPPSGWTDWLRPWTLLGKAARPTTHAPRWGMLVPVAAALIIVVALVVDKTRIPVLPTLARLEPLHHLTLATRGATDSAMQSYDEGMESYAAADYAAAATRLGQAVRQMASWREAPEEAFPSPAAREIQHDQAALYAGISWLMIAQSDSTLTYLGVAQRSRFPLIAEHAVWYLAQLRLLQDDREAAVTHLRRLAESSMAYTERAAEQLELIEAL